MDINTKISDLTIGELSQLIAQVVRQELQSTGTVAGIEGIAQIFGVSITTAKRIKASGIIDQAVSQSGRVIVTDVSKARQLYAQATHGRKKTI